MNDDFPLPHSPSIDMVSGGFVAADVKNAMIASTYGAKPSASSGVGWSPTAFPAILPTPFGGGSGLGSAMALNCSVGGARQQCKKSRSRPYKGQA